MSLHVALALLRPLRRLGLVWGVALCVAAGATAGPRVRVQSKSDGLWWSRDRAGHGGSAWKVFRQEGKTLRWYKDADEYGTFLEGKHKGDTGLSVPMSELSGTR